MQLAETAGLHDLLDRRLGVDTPNPVVKSVGIGAGILAGTDSLDDLDVLRHGATNRLFAGVRAPSTPGSPLSSFTHGHVLQLDHRRTPARQPVSPSPRHARRGG